MVFSNMVIFFCIEIFLFFLPYFLLYFLISSFFSIVDSCLFLDGVHFLSTNEQFIANDWFKLHNTIQ